jgi:hypothetical protein
MANMINTQELAETIAAYVKKSIPLLKGGRINTDLSDKLAPGSGIRVNVLVPGYGKVTEGPSFLTDGGVTNGRFNSTIDDIRVDRVPVDVKLWKTGVAYDIIDKSLRLNTFEEQVAKPYGAMYASDVNKKIFKGVQVASCSSIIGALSFKELSDAVAVVQSAYQDGAINGMLAPLARSAIVGTGANKFANDSIGKRLYNGEIGEFAGAEFFDSPDAKSLVVGSGSGTAWAWWSALATTTITDLATALNGASSIPVSPTVALPAGTPLVIVSGAAPAITGVLNSAFNVCDVFGNDIGVARTFVVSQDTPAGAPAIPVSEIRISNLNNPNGTNPGGNSTTGGTNKWAVPNTIISPDASGNSFTVVCPLLGGTQYYQGIVFGKTCVAFAGMTPEPIGGLVDTAESGLDGELNIRITTVPGGLEGISMWRMDGMYGINSLYGQYACSLYVSR